jgi:hypothetical protein
MKKITLKYIIRKISEDGLLKPVCYGSSYSSMTTEYDLFDSVEDAVKFCEENEISYVEIIPKLVPTWD